MIVKPVVAAPVTVAPGKPTIALSAVCRFALLYACAEPPTRAESFPPNRMRNGEKYVTAPPPVGFVVGAAGSSYWNERGVGTAVIGNVPANPPAVVSVTMSPTERPCARTVLIVAVVPTALAPGARSLMLPPPVLANPVAVGWVKVNARLLGTVSTVHVPLYSGTGTPVISTWSPGWRVWVAPTAPVEIVTVLPLCDAPPSCVALGAAPIATFSG